MGAVAAFFAGPIGRWLVVAALVASALFAGGLYERNVQKQKDDDKYFAERKAQEEVNLKAVNALNAKYRQQEKDNAAALAATGVEYEKNLKIAQGIRDRDVAAAKSGALRLSVAAHCGNAGDGSAPASAGTPGVGNGEARTELPQSVTGDLLALADDADATVVQLTACQTVIQNYLKGTQ
jgi:hypothetical protein